MRIGEAVKLLRRTLIKFVRRFVTDDKQGEQSDRWQFPRKSPFIMRYVSSLAEYKQKKRSNCKNLSSSNYVYGTANYGCVT
jgi:hypothetical protein